MITKKVRIRTIANEWFDDYSKLNYDVYRLDYDKKGYEEIISILKNKYKIKEDQSDTKTTVFEFERRGFVMDITVSRQDSGKAKVLSMVVCHFTNTEDEGYRISINKLITNDYQTAIQNKFPEIFDNKTVYYVEVVELPVVNEQDHVISYHDEGGITYTEFTDKEEAIESARILAKELSKTSQNCFCLTVIQGISNCRKRYTSNTKLRRERDVYTIGTKSIPETLLARRRYKYYPLSVDEYIVERVYPTSNFSGAKCIYILTIAINDNRQFVMTTQKYSSLEKAQNAAQNAVIDWSESNQKKKYSFEKFEFEYKFNTPNLLEVYSKSDKTRLTAMITEIPFDED